MGTGTFMRPTDPKQFVERPDVPRRSKGSLPSLLIQTATNGKAVLVEELHGGYYAIMKSKGLRLRTSKRGAPKGKWFAWCEKIKEGT
jgi:hypothetical protein